MSLPELQQLKEQSSDKLPNFRPRAGGYNLRKWYKYQQNLNYLKEHEVVLAKILFSALNDLEEEERAFLASKYCVPYKVKNGISVRPTDKELAEEQGMSLSKYKAKRHRLERKMSYFIAEYELKYKDEYEQSLWFKHGNGKRGGK
ncbi:hypothetical protein [Atopococcus tabaci]|uniref:hypothetical protein n=1 Tax=Atopococcus tabaci TaxID=269774 RepID=UPI00048204EE|nr:hypothetical protein [Atopococcus tabaci]